jgi:quercetin dioxygenase-like cupin family protein
VARVATVLFGALLTSAVIVHSQTPAAPATPTQPSQPAPSPAWEPPVVPVYHEPHHRQVFQKGPVRILDLQIPPGDMSWFHSHEAPVLYVTLGTSATRTQNLGGEWSGGGARGARPGGGAPATEGRGAPAGAAPPAGAPPAGAQPAGRAGGGRGAGAPRATSTTSYAQQPVTHRLENVGTGLFRAMVVINETPGDETATEQAAGFDAKPELTNRWFRAYRLTLAPGQKTPPHRHRAPVAIFQATPGKGLGAGPMTFEFNEPGQWAYFDADAPHEVSNVGSGPLELIEVEVRRP